MNQCAQCTNSIPHLSGIACDFSLDKTFCFDCWKMCTKCLQPTYFNSEVVLNGRNNVPPYSILCETCYEEYELYLDPPCPSHPLPPAA